MEWKEVLLGELVEIKHGFAFKGEYFTEEKTNDILLTPGNFAIGGGFQWGKLKFYDGPIPSDYILTEGDLVVTMTDLSKAGDTLGYSAIIPYSENLLLHNQRVGKIKTKTSSVDKMYLSYQLRTKTYRNEVLASATGSTVKHTSPAKICAYRFLLPLLDEQKAIASVLGALDDKIENNRRMNETLEEMAQAIFKSWFVDFDPVHAKAAGNAPAHMDANTAALFPSSFGDDGLPLGWVNNELSNVCSLLGGYAFKSKEFVNEGMPVVKIKNITGNGDVSLKDCQCIESKSTVGKDKFRLEDGDLLIAMTGATVGKTGIITDGKMTPYLNQRVGKFVPNLSFHKWAIWAYLQFQKNVDSVVATGTGSAQTNISSAGIISVKWTEATHEMYKVFDEIVTPYFDLWISNMHQNQTLAELRDTLLPKLMSGEICVKDAEREMGAAL